MRSLLLSFLTLFLVCCTGVEIGKMSKEEYCQKTWKFDLECALNHTLSDEEVQKISELAEKLKGENCKQTAWNALKWVEENLKYDYYKASLPPPTIITKGREVTVLNPERIYQTPEETMMLRKGICGDFAILTTAILIRN
ncbi:MAG: transglutaminase-like domain-containing protein, partial [Archaeoglobaceae archaeon]